MSNNLNGQVLIDSFLEAARLRRLDECQAVLRSLELLAQQQSAFKPWCRYMVGALAFETHRWVEAEQILTELLELDLEPVLRGRTWYTLGRSFDAQGRWDAALATFEHSLAAFTELKQVTPQAMAWKHMAISLHKGFTCGDFGPAVLAQAVTHCRSALSALETEIEPSKDAIWLKGTIWNTLGLIYASLEQWDEVIACYRQDLVICQALADRFGMGITYGNLGEVYQKQGNYPEALTAYHQALSLIREFQGHYEEIDVLADLAFLYQELGEYEAAFEHYRQAIQLIEQLRSGISSEAAQAGFFATVVDTYANLVLLCLTAGRNAQAFDYVERARSRTFLDSLTAGSSELSQKMEATPLTLTEIQAALPPDVLLLEYFTTGLVEAQNRQIPSNSDAQRHRFPPAKTLIFAVTHDGLQIYDTSLSPNQLRPRQLDNVVERHFLQPQIRRTLYDQLIAPVEKCLSDKRRLYLVPHGPLHYIPFQALIAPDGDTLLRESGPELVYAPSATILFQHRRREPGQVTKSCLVLGYNGERPDRLRFAEEEALHIAHLTGGQALVGSSPKKKNLYNQAPNFRLLHFSCHGDFDPEMPLASALHLAPAETLTALDVLNQLRLGCDLVTLSACESGLNRVRRGDELIGLTRAFKYAGTPAMISTLWRVDERSTLILMKKLYQEIQNGVSFAEALKRAQLYLKNLSREEALDVLARFLVDEMLDSDPSPGAGRSGPPLTEVAWQQAGAYLKGLALKGRSGSGAVLSDEKDDDAKIFADPFYWAPFVLVGSPDGGISGNE